MRYPCLAFSLALCTSLAAGPALAQPQDEDSLAETWTVARGSFSYRGRRALLRVDRETRQARVSLRAGDSGSVERVEPRVLPPLLFAQLELAAERSRETNWGAFGPRSGPATIRRLQERLLARRYEVEVSGSYDAKTRAAVARFQEHQFLRPTGRADEETRKRLGLAPLGGGYQLDRQSVSGRRIGGVMWLIAYTLVTNREPLRQIVRARVVPRAGAEVELGPEGQRQGLVARFLHGGYQEATALLGEGTFEVLTWPARGEEPARHAITRIYVETSPDRPARGVAVGARVEVIGVTKAASGSEELIVLDSAGRRGRLARSAEPAPADREGDPAERAGAVDALGEVGRRP